MSDVFKPVYTVCALIFAGFIFRGFANFAFFAFLNSRLLGTVVLKYSRVKYSRIYGVSPYTIIVYGSCRGAKLLESLFEDVMVSNGELHPRISHLQGGMDAFHWRKAWLRPRKKQQRRSVNI